jgi:serine/threonine protein kinase
MPAPASVPEFLDLVRKSGLLPDGRLDEVLARASAPATVDAAAAFLVRDSLLTFFQAKQLKLGRYKRFTIGSKYRLLELIGAGGMGAVYLCEHTLMRRLVALKVLPVEKLEDRSNEERFYREARAVAALDHPNIVRAYDIDHYEKLHFLVMEYVDGTSLQEVVARYAMDKRWFDPVRAAHYVAQSAIGMQHAHELGMVHRDIKPGNLLLDRTGVIKVLDMGLARFFNKQQDSVTEKYDDKCVLGTADYLAPEQAVSNMVDIRADIYALGGTLYFLLTGQTPFPDGTIAAKLVAHQTREPRPVESFRPDVPAGILAVLRKMMAKDPADRYQLPIEVADALAEWADLPADPPPPKEMPVHCPLVQALAGPPAGTGSAPSLARVLFAPGRGVFGGRNGPGSSGRMSRGSAVASAFPALAGGSNPGYPTRDPSGVPIAGPVSTARASTSPTSPLPPRSDYAPPAGEPGGPGTVIVVPGRRTGLYVVIGVLTALLLAVGAVAAYYIGKGDKAPDPDAVQVPTLNEVAFTPEQTAGLTPGMKMTVEFKVASAGGTQVAHLNSLPDGRGKDNFAAHVQPAAYRAAGKSLEQFLADYRGKVIRVHGTLGLDAGGSRGIEVRSPKQILVVSDG